MKKLLLMILMIFGFNIWSSRPVDENQIPEFTLGPSLAAIVPERIPASIRYPKDDLLFLKKVDDLKQKTEVSEASDLINSYDPILKVQILLYLLDKYENQIWNVFRDHFFNLDKFSVVIKSLFEQDVPDNFAYLIACMNLRSANPAVRSWFDKMYKKAEEFYRNDELEAVNGLIGLEKVRKMYSVLKQYLQDSKSFTLEELIDNDKLILTLNMSLKEALEDPLPKICTTSQLCKRTLSELFLIQQIQDQNLA